MSDTLTTLAVLQHTSSEFLGLLEDHLEGRRIRFHYFRPFTTGGRLPRIEHLSDGLVLLGGGPWGIAAGPSRLPSLEGEIALVTSALAAGFPLVGFGLGAQILALAGGGTAHASALTLEVGTATRTVEDALGGLLPAQYPLVRYGRDAVSLPDNARVLARDEADRWALFQLGERAFGFAGHPGVKSAIIEDLIMEFPEAPAEPASALAAVRAAQASIEAALVPIMAGLTRVLGLMPGGDGGHRS